MLVKMNGYYWYMGAKRDSVGAGEALKDMFDTLVREKDELLASEVFNKLHLALRKYSMYWNNLLAESRKEVEKLQKAEKEPSFRPGFKFNRRFDAALQLYKLSAYKVMLWSKVKEATEKELRFEQQMEEARRVPWQLKLRYIGGVAGSLPLLRQLWYCTISIICLVGKAMVGAVTSTVVGVFGGTERRVVVMEGERRYANAKAKRLYWSERWGMGTSGGDGAWERRNDIPKYTFGGKAGGGRAGV